MLMNSGVNILEFWGDEGQTQMACLGQHGVGCGKSEVESVVEWVPLHRGRIWEGAMPLPHKNGVF